MKKKIFLGRTVLACLLIALFSVSCISSGEKSSSGNPSKNTTYPSEYTEAIKDAMNPEPNEVTNSLIAISRDNKELIWKEINGIPHVLMVTITDKPGYYEESVGGPYQMDGYSPWVTAVPQVRDLCADPDWGGTDLIGRLVKYLGLAPGSSITHAVQMWVSTEMMFRPAPDMEIDDSTAGLTMPADTPSWYREWFNNQRATKYSCGKLDFQDNSDPPPCVPNTPYPWTQLGYTYDWGNPDTEKGASEFVVNKEATVYIEGIYPLDEYGSAPAGE